MFSPVPNIISHKVKVVSGDIRTGDLVEAAIDIDRRRSIRKNHSATHLLHSSLRQILGDHVKQSGSLVSPFRLRFDFTHFNSITTHEIKAIESQVNEKIQENIPITIRVTSYERAIKEGAVATFINYKNKKLKLIIDGKELPSDEYMVGAIANGKIFGKGMKIAPDACLDDGLFDIVLIKGMNMFEFCLNAWRLYAGSHLKHAKISLIRGKKVEVEPLEGEDALIEVDGEQLCAAPATFEFVPRIFYH